MRNASHKNEQKRTRERAKRIYQGNRFDAQFKTLNKEQMVRFL